MNFFSLIKNICVFCGKKYYIMKTSLLYILFFNLCFILVAHAKPSIDKPNFLFIFIDDMGFADPSCFGNPLVKTPHIDRLAKEGIKLTNFYVTSPICSASRTAVTTGQYQGRWGIHSYLHTRAANAARGMNNFLDASAPTTARKMKAAGYATGHFGKWHMGGGRDVEDAPLPQEYGFDESLVSFEGLGDRLCFNKNGLKKAQALGRGKITLCERYERTDIQVDYTIDFIRRNKDRPFYVRFFPNDVHAGHFPKEGEAEKYKHLSDNHYDWDFFAVLQHMDEQIGRLIDELDKLGLREKTLIIFTSDNGPTDGAKKYLSGEKPAGYTGPYRGRKWSNYEGGIRMPFIASWPGTIPEGVEDDTSIMSSLDLSPTFCKFAGVSVEDSLDGIDRGAVLLGKPSDRGKALFWQYGHPHSVLKGGKEEHLSPTFAMREGRWKLLMNPDGSEAQLYDLEADEGETMNLFDARPERVASMAAQLGECATEIGYDFDHSAKPAPPGPMKAVLAGNQLLNFNNHGGVAGDYKAFTFAGDAWLDLPGFRAPKLAGGRNLQVKGNIGPKSGAGVIFAQGDDKNGWSLYLDGGILTFAAVANGERKIITAPTPITAPTDFEASWNSKGNMILKIGKKLVARGETKEVIQVEPSDTIQIGADAGKAIGEYESPNTFEGTISNLTFKYPNGS